MIALQDVCLSYGRSPVLREFTMRLQPARVSLIVGANGAGKSTALKVAAGLLKPDRGTVHIEGIDLLRQRRRAQECMSYLPQNVAFHPKLRVRDVLRFYASARGCAAERIEQELLYWGLEKERDKRSGQLSGGLRQRLGLAVLMLPASPVLILDEPGISLDPEWRERMQARLLDEAGQGRSVLVATHLLGEWQGRAQECLLCEDGRISRSLDPDQLRLPAGRDDINLRAV